MKRYWFPVLLLVLWAGLAIWLFSVNHFARYFGTTVVGMLVIPLIFFWYMLRRGVSGRKKLGVLGLCLLAPLAFLGLFKYEGFAGTGLPEFSFRFAGASEGSNTVEVKGENLVDGNELGDLFYNFAGPDRNNMLAKRSFGTDWAANPPEELWRRPMGTGWGSFSISNGRAFTLEQHGNEEWTSCYDLATGEPIWTTKRSNEFFEVMSGTGPRSTPFIEDDRLFALGVNGHLACQSVEDGSKKWEINILGENENLIYGVACTPLRVGELVVVSGGLSGGTLLAYNAETGEKVWAAGDKTEESRYGSPRLVNLAGRDVILALNQNTLTGHDPKSGEVVLTIDWPGKVMPRSSQPILLNGDRLFATASYGMNSFVAKISAGADGTLVSEDIWRRNRMKNKFSSTQVVDGYAYGLDEGIFCCIDLSNGDKIWKGGRYGYGQNLLIEDVLLVQCERGDVVLVAPDPSEHKEIARLESALPGKTWNAPSIAGRLLLVRNGEEAACYRLPER